MIFADRHQAGRLLSGALERYRRAPDAVVLALPRGGVPVGAEIADALDLPLDVLVVRKLGAPGYEELAVGAIASGDALVLNDDVIRALCLPPEAVERVREREAAELARRELLYRGHSHAAPIEGRVAILVDDGLATGATMRAAVAAVRTRGPKRVVVAVPVAAREAVSALSRAADDCVALSTPADFACSVCPGRVGEGESDS